VRYSTDSDVVVMRWRVETVPQFPFLIN